MFVNRCLVVFILSNYLTFAFGEICTDTFGSITRCPELYDEPSKVKCCNTGGLVKCCTAEEYNSGSIFHGLFDNTAFHKLLNDKTFQGLDDNAPLHNWQDSRSERNWEITTSTDTDHRFPVIALAIAGALLCGIIFTCFILCLCCPCCILYKRRKRGAVYRRVEAPVVTVPQANQPPSAVVAANHPVAVSYQPPAMGPAVVHTGYNQAPQLLDRNFSHPAAAGPMLGYPVYNQAPQPQAAMQPPPPPYSAAVTDEAYPKQAPYNPMYPQ